MSITRKDIALPPSFYEAYVYEYTNLDNNKKYIGYHKGSVDDSYNHSATCDEFRREFTNPNSSFEYRVIDYGYKEEMAQLEYNLLSKMNAAKNPQFYNKSNGFRQYKSADVDKCIQFVQSLKDAELYPRVMEDIRKHVEMNTLQVRFQHDPDHQRLIKQKIDDKNGDTSKCNPVIVMEGRGADNSDLRVDGNHTVFGASMSANATDIPVIRVPYDENKDFSFAELRIIGNLLNGRPDVVKKFVQPSDGIKLILDFHKEGIPYGAPENIKALQAMGFTGAKSKGEIKTILEKAKKQIDLNDGVLAGKNFIDYKSKSHRGVLQSVVDQYQGMTGICSIAMTSGKLSIERILEALEAGRITGNKKCMVVVHHPSPEQGKLWKEDIQPKWMRIIRHFITNCEIEFTELPMWDTDTTGSQAETA
jgi:hypothetical protein